MDIIVTLVVVALIGAAFYFVGKNIPWQDAYNRMKSFIDEIIAKFKK